MALSLASAFNVNAAAIAIAPAVPSTQPGPAEKLKFRSLYMAITSFLGQPKDLSGVQDLDASLKACWNKLLSNPLEFEPKDSAERERLNRGETQAFEKQAALSSQEVSEVLRMSDDLNVSERSCLEIWRLATLAEERIKLEELLGTRPGELQRDIPLSARRLFFVERGCQLASICELLKARLAEYLVEEKSHFVKRACNELIRSDLPTKLLACIRASLVQHADQSSAISTYTPGGPGVAPGAGAALSVIKATFVDEVRMKAAECVFYIFYATQIKANELCMLIETLELVTAELSKTVSTSSAGGHAPWAGSHAIGAYSAAGASAIANAMATDREVSLMNTAMILHFSLCCALETRVQFEDRHTGMVQEKVGNALHEWDRNGKGASKDEIQAIEERLTKKAWSHRPFQGAACIPWAVFLAPALVTTGFGKDVQACQSALRLALNCRGFSHLNGPTRTALLALKHAGDSSIDFYQDVYAELLTSYLKIGFGESPEHSWGGDILPLSKASQKMQDEYAAQQQRRTGTATGTLTPSSVHNSTSSGPVAPQPSPDHLEDVLSLLSSAAEGLLSFGTRCWTHDLGLKLLHAVDERVKQDQELQTPKLLLAAALASCGPTATAQIYAALGGHTYGWAHLLPNFYRLADQLASGVRPPPSPRALELLSALATLLGRCLGEREVSGLLLAGTLDYAEGAVMWALMKLVGAGGVPPFVKGAAFKALAAAATQPQLAEWLWEQLETMQALGGVRAELESEESLSKSYPSSEGFACLLQQLCLSRIPFSLGAGKRRPGLTPYLMFLINDVVAKAPNREYKDQAQRWKLTSRALQAIAALIRRYPLCPPPPVTGTSKPTSLLQPTPEDIDECRMDFGAVSAFASPETGPGGGVRSPEQSNNTLGRRSPSPGFGLMLEILSGGPLFRALVEVLVCDGGPAALGNAREEFGKKALKKVLRATLGRTGYSGGSGSGVGGWESVQQDWTWWKERAVALALSILQAVAEREETFRLQHCHAPPPLLPPPGSSLNSWQIGALWGDPPPGPLAAVATLLSDARKEPIAAISDCVTYTRSAALPYLALCLLQDLTRKLEPERLALAAGRAGRVGVACAFALRLYSSGMEDGASRMRLLRSGVAADDDANDTEFKTLDPGLLGMADVLEGVAASAEEQDIQETAQLDAAVVCSMLDLLLAGVESGGLQANSSLVLNLLGMDRLPMASTGSASIAPLPTSNCFCAVLHLLRTARAPVTSSQDRGEVVEDVASFGGLWDYASACEKALELVYRLLAMPTTVSFALSSLKKYKGFFEQQLNVAVEAVKYARLCNASTNTASSRLHSLAWLLQSAALALHASTVSEIQQPLVSKNLLALLLLSPAGTTSSSGGDRCVGVLARVLSESDLEEGGPRGALSSRAQQAARAAAVPLPGPRDIAGRFTCIDIDQFLKALESQATESAPPTASTSGGAMDVTTTNATTQQQSELKASLTWAVEYNEYASRLCARSHMCEGWRQAAEMSAATNTALKPYETRSAFVSLLTTLLRTLSTGSAGSKGCPNPLLAEPLGRAASCMMAALRPLDDACSASGAVSTASAPGRISHDELKPVLFALVEALLRGGGGIAAGVAGTRSAAVRASLYGCLSHYLQLTQGEGGGGGQSEQKKQVGHRLQNMATLESASERGLITQLGKDACMSPPACRVLALCSLSAVLATLSQGNGLPAAAAAASLGWLTAEEAHNRARRAADAATRAIEDLKAHGRLVAIVDAASGFRTAAAGNSSEGAGVNVKGGETAERGGEDAKTISESALVLLTQIATIESGAWALIECNALNILPPLIGNEKSTRSLSHKFVADTRAPPAQPLLPSLYFAQAMASSLPHKHALAPQLRNVLTASAARLHKVLTLEEDPSLSAIKAAGAVASLLPHALLASKQLPANTAEAKHWGDGVLTLLSILGRCPYPAKVRTNGVRRARQPEWWDVFQPSNPSEVESASRQCPPPLGAVSTEWSEFDAHKLEASQVALSHAVTCYRSFAEQGIYGEDISAELSALAPCLNACLQVHRFCGGTTGAFSKTPRTVIDPRYSYLPQSIAHSLEGMVAGLYERTQDPMLLIGQVDPNVQPVLQSGLGALAVEGDALVSGAARIIAEVLNIR